MADDSHQQRKSGFFRKTLPRAAFVCLILLCTLLTLSSKLPDFSPTTESSYKGIIVTKVLVIVNRHGARSALQHFDFEGFDWDVPLGQLTVNGMHQAFDLGIALRKRILVSEIDRMPFSKFSAYATYIERTIETARAMILGMVYGDRSSLFLESGNCSCRVSDHPARYPCIEQCLGIPEALRSTEPLPEVHIIDRNTGNIGWMMQYDRCEGLPERTKALHASAEYNETVNTKYQSELVLLRQIVGNRLTCMDKISAVDHPRGDMCVSIDIDTLEMVWDDFTAAVADEKKVRQLESREHSLLSILGQVVQWKWNIGFDKEIGKLAGGILLNEITTRIESIIKATPKQQPPRKILPVPYQAEELIHTIVFSGHDKTVASLLSVLGASDWRIPGYAGYVSITIKGPVTSRRLDEHLVEIEYNGRPLSTDSCSSEGCSFSSFLDQTIERRMSVESCVMRP